MSFKGMRRAMAALDSPSAQANTIWARCTMPWGSACERVMLSSSFFSPSLGTMGPTGRPRGMGVFPDMDTLKNVSPICGTLR